MSRLQTAYDEWLEKPYQDKYAEDERELEDGEEWEEPEDRDADDWRDEMMERRWEDKETT